MYFNHDVEYKQMSVCKTVKTNIYKIAVTSVLFCSIFCVVFYVLHTYRATGSTSDNVSGYAWSETIGWISFNCTNTGSCPSVDYGVTVDGVTGDISGHAWSSNIRWINFDPAGPYPEVPNHSARLEADDTVTGWAKAIDADGVDWDGWIKMSDTAAPAYGVTLNTVTDEFEGFAWGYDVMGWISFNCIDTASCALPYSVSYSLANAIPTCSITAPATGNYDQGSNITFTGWSDDTNGDVIGAEWRDYGGVSAVGDCDDGVVISTALDLVTEISSFSKNDLTLGVHNICFRVQDDDSAWSSITSQVKEITIVVPATECSDGIDNDGDGYIDNEAGNEDTGCYDLSTTPPTYDPSEDEAGSMQCSDNIDNDTDGDIDMADAGCADFFDDSEENTICGNDICDPGETYPTCPQDCPFTIEPF